MGEMDAFVKVSRSKSSERPFITLRDRSITFSKSAIEYLGYSEYIDMYIDKKGKRAAFKACKKYDGAFPFYKPPKEGRPVLVRISDKKMTKMLLDLAMVEDPGKGMRFYGHYNEEESLLVIDMHVQECR